MKTPSSLPENTMNAMEKRTGIMLSGVYALRMLGIFLLLPVFTLYASDLPGGNNAVAVGLAFGIYGLTQAIFQLPIGMASDKFGRKKVIYCGLLIFAAGSFLSAWADTVFWLTIARALQGAGAVSAAVIALLADLTREEVRTRAMAMIGLSIGLTFSVSLILGPLLDEWIGVRGIFVLTGILILLAIVFIHFMLPNPQQLRTHEDAGVRLQLLPKAIKNSELWRLNFGIFALHCAQMALFVSLPFVLEHNLHFDSQQHWQFYLPLTLLGIVLMVPAVIVAEKKHRLKPVLLISIMVMALAQGIFALSVESVWGIVVALGLYFVGLNVLEAILPSWVSKVSPAQVKGTAMGIYNTMMSLGIFSGSLIGGWILHRYGAEYVFYFCSILMLLWALLAWFAKQPRAVRSMMFAVPPAWQNNVCALQAALKQVTGVAEAALSEDEHTIYLKVLVQSFDEHSLTPILYGE